MLDSTIVFNEIMYHPADDGVPEWVELHNQMAVDVDLSGWSLRDAVRFDFPAGTTVPGGAYLVVAADVDAVAAATGHLDALGPFAGSLANGGEQIELRNNNDRVMNALDYGDNSPWPIAPDGSGATLAKIDEGTSSEPAANWAASRQVGGTPGRVNFAETATVTLESTLIELDAAWAYDDSGTDWGAAWRDAAFDDSAWSTGAGLFFDTADTLPGNKNTPLANGRNTYYFRTEFEFDGNPQDALLQLAHVVDDGAVVYLNGAEALRINMPAGAVTSDTMALGRIPTAELVGPVVVPTDAIVSGTNVLAVEVHQAVEVGEPVAVPIDNATFEADASHPLSGPTGWVATGINLGGYTRVTFNEGNGSPVSVKYTCRASSENVTDSLIWPFSSNNGSPSRQYRNPPPRPGTVLPLRGT